MGDKVTKGVGLHLEEVIKIGPNLNFLQGSREWHFLYGYNEYLFISKYTEWARL